MELVPKNKKVSKKQKFNWPEDVLRDNLIFAYSKFGISRPRYTVAGIIDPDKRTIKVGVSRCSNGNDHQKPDQFSRNYGREKALERARVSTIGIAYNENENPRRFFAKTAKTFMTMEAVLLTETPAETEQRNLKADRVEAARIAAINARKERKAKKEALRKANRRIKEIHPGAGNQSV